MDSIEKDQYDLRDRISQDYKFEEDVENILSNGEIDLSNSNDSERQNKNMA